ncbi:hypothetical protein D3C87_2199230 [compost metagenome]
MGAGLLAKAPDKTPSVPDQFVVHFGTELLIQLPPKLLLAGNLGSNRQPVAIHQPIARQRRDFRAGQ